MKLIKNNIKGIIGFLIGVILTGGVAYAATSASKVDYTTPKNENIINVEGALNDLYSLKTNLDNIEISTAVLGSNNSVDPHTFSATEIPNYENLSASDFCLSNVHVIYANGVVGSVEQNISTSYNTNINLISYEPSTGTVTVARSIAKWSNRTAWLGYTLVCKYLDV